MKRLTILLLALLFLIFMGACAETTNNEPGNNDPVNNGSANNDAVNNTNQPEEIDLQAEGLPAFNESIASLDEVTIDVWFASDYVEEPPIVDAIKEFQSVYSNVQINAVGFPWEDLADKIRKSVSGGNPPDVVHGEAYVLGSEGFVEPVNDLWDAWGEEDQFLNGAINSVTWAGDKYGMPIELNTTFYIYDKDLFEAENVDPPTTMDELIEVSNQLTEDARYGFVGEANGWNVYSYIVAAGGDLIEEQADGTVKVSLNNDVVVDVIEKYTDLAKVDKAAPIPPPQARQQDNPIAMFSANRAAAFVSGPWDLALLEAEFPDKYATIGTAVVPGLGEGSVAGGGSLYIPKGAENKEVGFEFMKWISSEKYGKRLAEEMGRTPVRGSLFDLDIFDDPILAPFIETLENARTYPLIEQEVRDAFDDAIRDIFDGDDAKTRLDKAQDIAEEAVKRAEG